MDQERIQLIIDMGRSGADVQSVSAELAKLDAAAKTTAKGGANLSNAMRDTGRVIQDVVSSGQISAAANNMEQFAASLGLGAGVGAGLQIVLTLAPVAIGLLKSLANVGETKPPALDMMEQVNGALKDAKDRLDRLKESWTGATGEAETYAKAAADVVRLEKEANDERERRAKLDAMRKAEASANAGENPESAKKAAEVIRGAGGTDAVLGQLTPQFIANYGGFIEAMDRVKKTTETMNRRLSEESDPINQAAIREFYGNQMKADQAAVGKAQQEADAKARDLLARGGSGDQGALEELNKRLPNAGFFGATTYAINHEAEVQATIKRDQEQAKRQADAEAKAAEDRKKADRDFEDNAYKHTMDQRRQEEADKRAKEQADRQAEQERAAGVREQQGNMSDAHKATLAQRDASDTADLRRIAQNELGTDLTDSQAADALKQARAMVEQGFAPGIAARQSILDAMRGFAGVMMETQRLMQFQAAEIAEMRMYIERLRQGQQRMPSLLSRGRQGSGQEGAANPWPVIEALAAKVDQIHSNTARTTPTRMARGRFGAPGDAAISGAEFDSFAATVRENVDLIHERVGRLMRQQPTTPSLLTWGSGW